MKLKAVFASLFGASLHLVDGLNVKIADQVNTSVTSCDSKFDAEFERTYSKDGTGSFSTRCLPSTGDCYYDRTTEGCYPLVLNEGGTHRGFVIHSLLNIDGSQLEYNKGSVILDTGRGFRIIASKSSTGELAGEMHSFRIGVQVGSEAVHTFRTCYGHEGFFSFYVRYQQPTVAGGEVYAALEVYREGELLGSTSMKLKDLSPFTGKANWVFGCDQDGSNCVPAVNSTNSADAVKWLRWGSGDVAKTTEEAKGDAKRLVANLSKLVKRTEPVCGNVEVDNGEVCDWSKPIQEGDKLVQYTEFTHPRCSCTCNTKCPEFTSWASSVGLSSNFHAAVNSTHSSSGTNYKDFRLVQCAAGYSSDADNLGEVLECQKDGSWTKPTLSCHKNCQGLPTFGQQYMVVSDTQSPLGTDAYYHGSKMEVACAPNHAPAKGMPVGVTPISCQDGQWSTAALKCYPTCGEFPDLGGKQYITGAGQGDMLGASRKVTCAPGFSSTTGVTEQNVRCELSGKWSNILLDCQADCSSPNVPAAPLVVRSTSRGGVSTLSSVTKAGEWYKVGCASGYSSSASSGEEAVYCIGGSWTSVTMACSLSCPSETEFKAGAGLNSPAYDVAFGGSNHGDASIVKCSSGYSTAPSSVSVDSAGAESFTRGTSDEVRCLNGAFETPRIECFKECPVYTAPNNFYEVVWGQSTGSGHGAYRHVQCRPGYETAQSMLEGGMKEDVSYCVDGQWSAVSLTCAPGCTTTTLNSYFCDLDKKTKKCRSRFDLQWQGVTKEMPNVNKEWSTQVPAGTEFQVRCNEGLQLTTQDGSRNNWKTVRCLGSTSTTLEVQWSLVNLSCGSRCDLAGVDFGSAYNLEIQLPGQSLADTYGDGETWMSAKEASAQAIAFERTVANLLEIENDYISEAQKNEKLAIEHDAHVSAVSFLQLGASAHAGAWLGRATAAKRAEYLARSNMMVERGLATLAPTGDAHSLAAFHKIPNYQTLSVRAEAMQYPTDKATFTVSRLHAKRIQAYKDAGVAVPTALVQLSAAASNSRAVAAPSNSRAKAFASEPLLAMPRLPFLMPVEARKEAMQRLAKENAISGDATSFIQITQVSATQTKQAVDAATNSTCGDADDLFGVLMGAYADVTCASVVAQNDKVCGLTAKELLKSISGTVPPEWQLDPRTDVGLICAASCQLCDGRSIYAAASGEYHLTGKLDSKNQCVNRNEVLATLTPGWNCNDLVTVRGPSVCQNTTTIEGAFVAAGVDPRKSTTLFITEETLAMPFSDLCPVACSTCDAMIALKDEIFQNYTIAENERNTTAGVIIEIPSGNVTDSVYQGLLVPHGSKARLSCNDGYSDASVYAASLEGSDDGDNEDGDGVSVVSHAAKNSTANTADELLTCSLGAWSPRTLQCASHCDEYELPRTFTENYSLTGSGTQHGSMRTLSCAAGAFGTQGFNSQEVYCLDGKWTSRTLDCRRSCNRDELPASKTGMVYELTSDGIDGTSKETRRYSHGSKWVYECTPTAVERSKAIAIGTILERNEVYNAIEDAGKFIKNNAQQVVCNNGQWSQLVLICKRDCGEAPLPDTNRYVYTAHLRKVNEWEFLEKNQLAAPPASAVAFVQGDSKSSKTNPTAEEISTRHGDYLNVSCAPGYSAVAGPDSGSDTLKCMDGQWQPQTLVCKKTCREYSPPSEELQSNRYLVVSPDHLATAYPYTGGELPHGTQRILRCNSEEDNYPITSASEGRVTCQDGIWTTPLLMCRRSCMALNPAQYATGQLFTHYPPWGYCVWDPYLESCIDTKEGWMPPHNTRVWLNCAPGFSPVSGVSPTEVQCNDGIYTTIWLTCSPECDRSRLNIPPGMKVISSVQGHVDTARPSDWSDYVALPNTTVSTFRPKGKNELAGLGDNTQLEGNNAVQNNNEKEKLEKLASSSSFLQMHARHQLLSRTGAHAINYRYVHGMDVRDRRYSASDLMNTSVDANVKNLMGDHTENFKNENGVTDTTYLSVAILQAQALSGEITLTEEDVSSVPVTHASVLNFGCEDWAAPAPGTESGASTSCFWGSWTLRALQCKGRCTGDAPKQMLSQYERSDAYTLHATQESFLPGGSITIECVDGIADPWPTRYGGGRTETAICVDGAFSALTMSCMHRCEVHPLEASERYVIEAETTYGSAGIYQHGSVMRISCAEGYTASIAANNETSTCIDGTWSSTSIQCFKDCPVFQNPGIEYWVGPMTDRLRLGWAGDTGVTYMHGEDLWMTCAPGFNSGIGMKSSNVTVTCNDGAFTQPDIICYEACPPVETLFFDSYKYQFKRLNDAENPTLSHHNTQYQISCNTDDGYFHTGDKVHFKETVTCRDGSWGEPQIKCRKACPVFGLSANTVGLTASYGYSVKAARPSTFWTPGKVEPLESPNAVMKDTLYHLHGSFRVLSCNDNYSPSRRNDEGTVTPWEGDLLPHFDEGTMSVRTTTNNYVATSHNQTEVTTDEVSLVANTATAAGTELLLRTGEDALVCDDGEWKGRSLVCLKKCSEFVHPFNQNSDNAKRYDVWKLAEEQYAGYDGDVEAEMTMDLVNVVQNKLNLQIKVAQGSRRVVTCAEGFWPQTTANLHFRYDGMPAAVTECKDGYWTSIPMTCMRQCSEPYNNVLFRMCKDYHLNNPTSACANDAWMAYFNSKDKCALALCSTPGEGLNGGRIDESRGAASFLQQAASRASRRGPEFAGGNEMGIEGEMEPTALLQAAAHAQNKGIFDKLFGKDKKDKDKKDNNSGSGNANGNGSNGGSVLEYEDDYSVLRNNISPYKIFHSVITPDPWNFPDMAFNDTIMDKVKMAMKATKPGDAHVVMCNSQAGFGPVYRQADGMFTSDHSSVAVVTCVDGVWTDLPFRCDRGCVGAFDLYAKWERWLPVFTMDLKTAFCQENRLHFHEYEGLTAEVLQAQINSMVVNNTDLALDQEDMGIDFHLSAPGGHLHKDTTYGKYVASHDLVGRADGMFCDQIEKTEADRIPRSIVIKDTWDMHSYFPIAGTVAGNSPYKWPLGKHWAIWGPGCCNPNNCWTGSNEQCSKRIYGRGSWVAYEALNPKKQGLREAKRAVYYARCNAGGSTLVPTVSFSGNIVENALKNVQPVIQYKPNPDTSQSVRSFSWTTPELPIRHQNTHTHVMWPLSRKKEATAGFNKVMQLDCQEMAGAIVRVTGVSYKARTGRHSNASVFEALQGMCNGNTFCAFRVLNANVGAAASFANCPKSWKASSDMRVMTAPDMLNNINVEIAKGDHYTGPTANSVTFAQLSKVVSSTGESVDESHEHFTDPGTTPSKPLSKARAARLERNRNHVKALLKANENMPEGILRSNEPALARMPVSEVSDDRIPVTDAVSSEASAFVQTAAARRVLKAEPEQTEGSLLQRGAKAAADLLRSLTGRSTEEAAQQEEGVSRDASEATMSVSATSEATEEAHALWMAALEEDLMDVEAIHDVEAFPVHVLSSGAVLDVTEPQAFVENLNAHLKDVEEGKAEMEGATFSFLQVAAKSTMRTGFFSKLFGKKKKETVQEKLEDKGYVTAHKDTKEDNAKAVEKMVSAINTAVLGKVHPDCSSLELFVHYYCEPQSGFGSQSDAAESRSQEMIDLELDVLARHSDWKRLDDGLVTPGQLKLTKTAADSINLGDKP